MSKALLIIDMPRYCGICPCFGQDEDFIFCGVNDEILHGYHGYSKRPDWCPLIDIKECKQHMDPLEYVVMKNLED